MAQRYRRPNGQFGTSLEKEAHERGVLHGIGIGVARAARAMAMPIELLWSMIRRTATRRPTSRHRAA
jgi:hypothetical protein